MSDQEASAPGTVLAVTDFSDNAASGLDWAVEIARGRKCRLDLVHALQLPGPLTDFLVSPPDASEQLEIAALRRLEQEASRLEAKGVEVVPDLRIGLPSQAILEAARERRPDLVVVGTRGHSAIHQLFLGTTARRIVQHASCPVLTVHPKERARPVRTILAPTDFSDDASLAADAALRLFCCQDPIRLVLLHAYHLPIEYTAYGSIPTGLNYLEDIAGSAAERLAVMAESLRRPGLSVETRCSEGYPSEAIVEEARTVGADLIVMGTHGRTGLAHLLLGSNAERVVEHAPCPVLTVPRRSEDS